MDLENIMGMDLDVFLMILTLFLAGVLFGQLFLIKSFKPKLSLVLSVLIVVSFFSSLCSENVLEKYKERVEKVVSLKEDVSFGGKKDFDPLYDRRGEYEREKKKVSYFVVTGTEKEIKRGRKLREKEVNEDVYEELKGKVGKNYKEALGEVAEAFEKRD